MKKLLLCLWAIGPAALAHPSASCGDLKVSSHGTNATLPGVCADGYSRTSGVGSTLFILYDQASSLMGVFGRGETPVNATTYWDIGAEFPRAPFVVATDYRPRSGLTRVFQNFVYVVYATSSGELRSVRFSPALDFTTADAAVAMGVANVTYHDLWVGQDYLFYASVNALGRVVVKAAAATGVWTTVGHTIADAVSGPLAGTRHYPGLDYFLLYHTSATALSVYRAEDRDSTVVPGWGGHDVAIGLNVTDHHMVIAVSDGNGTLTAHRGTHGEEPWTTQVLTRAAAADSVVSLVYTPLRWTLLFTQTNGGVFFQSTTDNGQFSAPAPLFSASSAGRFVLGQISATATAGGWVASAVRTDGSVYGRACFDAPTGGSTSDAAAPATVGLLVALVTAALAM